MLDKIFAFLGFNSSDNFVGLSSLADNSNTISKKIVEQPKKELKLSDLMRGN